ncbi:MAG: glycosyltransferase [Candidatus Methanoperedens sp.]|nr:glycosyltransferase [Candidatus Methanoperedens sp.]MCZ7370647.1 glycosyltransferase [Candidatus Methanoperedens sp.]
MLFDKKYAIITHHLFTGAGQDLYRFLKKNNTRYVLLVQHSFSSLPDRKTTFTEFNKNKENIIECLDYKLFPDTIIYIKDFFYSFFGIFFNKNKFDLIVGCGGFNALSALSLKWAGKCEKVVFYTIDYAPIRFNNKFLNKIYHSIDKICVRYCDQTWNLSPRMAEGRGKYNNMPTEKYNKQKVVPIGVWLEDLPQINKKYGRKTLIFVGHLLEKQGVQLVLKAIPEITNKIRDFNFIIIGNGEYETELKKLAYHLEIDKYVEFRGPIYDSKELNKILGKSHIAVAMYDNGKASFTYYADPTKLKTYFAMGLPVLLTDIPYNAHEIERCHCGKIIRNNVESIKSAIIELIENEDILKEYSINATKYIKQFDYNEIFMRNLNDV